MSKYVAKISRNFKDTHSGDPKVLFRGVQSEQCEVRDHMWVSISKDLDKFLKVNKTNKSFIIEFEAQTKEYLYRGVEKKLTLKNVKSIRILGRA